MLRSKDRGGLAHVAAVAGQLQDPGERAQVQGAPVGAVRDEPTAARLGEALALGGALAQVLLLAGAPATSIDLRSRPES